MRWRAHDGGRLTRADPLGDVLDRPDGGREPDALGGRSEQGVETLEREGQVSPALRAGDRVYLVEDDRVDSPERLPTCRSKKQEKRLGCRDEDVCRCPRESGALGRRGVARSRCDGDLGDLDPKPTGLLGDPDERASQVSIDVDRKGLEGGDIQDAAAPGRVRLDRR